MRIAIIDTGCANLASVRFALDRLDVATCLVKTPEQARDSDRLILPGVGAAKPAMERLIASGWAEFLQQENRPLLGICLGMQLLFDRSEEGDVTGLGLFPGKVVKLPRTNEQIWPHMGWNALDNIRADEPLLVGITPGSHVYFVHGYAAPVGNFTQAESQFNQSFSAFVRNNNIVGCQFHPERSGPVGARILANFAGVTP